MNRESNSNRTFLFKINELQTLYLSITAIFLCTGFFYNFFFFRLFGIRAEFFFTLQDYLASSIEKVYIIVIAILASFLGSNVIRYLSSERNLILEHRLIHGLLCLAPVFLFAVGLIVIVKFDNSTGYYLLSFSIYVICDYLLFKILFKGNHESYSKFFILTVFLLYLLLISSTILVDRDAVYKEPLNELKRYRIRFTKGIDLNQQPLVLLEANSNYFFFYDKQTQRSIVMRKEMIEYVENLR